VIGQVRAITPRRQRHCPNSLQAFVAQLVHDVPLMQQVVTLANSELDATVPVKMQFAPSVAHGTARIQGSSNDSAVLGVPTSCQDLTRNRTT
jgi:hypothetical protein